MIKGTLTDPLIMAFMCGALGSILWWQRHHWQRFTAWLFAAAAMFVTLAVPVWRDALAWLTVTQTGRLILLVLSLIVGAMFYLEAIRTHRPNPLRKLLRKLPGMDRLAERTEGALAIPAAPSRPQRHHRVRTPVIAMMAGSLVVVMLGAARLMAESAAASARGAAQALMQSNQQISSGQAAASESAAQARDVLVIGVVILVAVALFLHHTHKKQTGGGKSPRAAGVRSPAFGRDS